MYEIKPANRLSQDFDHLWKYAQACAQTLNFKSTIALQIQAF